MKIIISGGGTGGHIFPAIAIANALKAADPKIEILFVGAEGKMEMEKVPQAGYPIEGLWISGFQRNLSIQNLFFPFKLLHSMWKARRILHQFKPDVCVGVGGYASGAILKVAQTIGIPTVLQEQNSFAGVTNKLLAAKAKKVCVAYDNMEQFFPADRLVLTGNPVRQDIIGIETKRQAASNYYQLEANKPTLLVMGGSLGARTLNQSMAAAYDFWKNHPEIQVLWQCGKLYIDELKRTEVASLPNIKLLPFLDKMDFAYAISDVVVSRAGALSVSELCLVGKPAILVPSPNVAEDHQTKNAMALVEKKAAILVKDADVCDTLLNVAYNLLIDKDLQKSLHTNILTLRKPNSAKDIAEIIVNIANGN